MAHELQRENIIRESTTIQAPIERCWALSIRVELVQKTLGMKLAGGVTQGSIAAGSRVAWSGWKFGLPTQHHTFISRFESPHTHFLRDASHEITKEAMFRDEQEQGRFAAFHHDHCLREQMDGDDPLTVLADEVHFRLPFGFLGEIFAKYVMGPYIRKLARQRFAMLKELAEGDGWLEWIADGVISPGSRAMPEPASHSS